MATEYFNDAWRIPNNKNQSLVSNYSMDFDGINDKIDFGDVNGFDITDKFSGSCWIYPTAAGNDFILGKEQPLSPYKGYMLYIDANRKLRFIMAVQYSTNYFGVASSSAIPYNTWTHLAFTYDGSTDRTGLKLYINSVLKTVSYTGNSTISGSMLDSTVPFQISGRGGSATSGVNGKIDQVTVFDYELSQDQVATLYGGGTAVINPMSLSPKPVAYYQLGDQTASNDTTEPTPPVQSYLVPNNSLQDYVFASGGSLSGYIDLANPVPLGTNKTVSFWFKLSSSSYSFSPFTSIVNSGNCYYPFVTSVSGRWYVSDAACTGGSFLQIGSGATLQVNQWLHAAAVGDGSSIKCYINGVEILSNASDRNPTIQRLIYQTTNAQTEFSNFSIFNTNLPATGTESIASLYNNGNPPDLTNYSNISHWWKLNAQDTFDGSNWIVKDYIGSNDGTSNGMTSANLVQSNLQHTSGYSPYALSFDGSNQEFDIPSVSTLELYNTDFSISFWCKVDASVSRPMFFEKYTGGGGWSLYVNNDSLRFYNGSGWTYISGAFQTVYAGLWTNVTVVGDLASTNLKCYINGNEVHSSTNTLIQIQNTDILTMAGSNLNAFSYAGELSNVAIWSGTALSAAQVTEVYNQGIPINLNTFSGNKPNHWWQLGSNSSFNAGAWTCLDEGISASTIPLTSAVSTTNMAEDDITNGVGYSGNGLGTSSIEIVGDAPYSTANGISENMDVLDRTTDVPS